MQALHLWKIFFSWSIIHSCSTGIRVGKNGNFTTNLLKSIVLYIHFHDRLMGVDRPLDKTVLLLLGIGSGQVKKLFSQMTPNELETEMLEIVEAMSKVEFSSQKELLERKYYTAKSYTLDPSNYPPGLYEVEGEPGDQFQLQYLNGIMGWGSLRNEEASYPLSMLKRVET